MDGAELVQLKNQGFAYEIWRVSPDTNERQIISSSNYAYNKNSNYVEQPMQILNAEWFFKLSPIKDWYDYLETWIFTFLGILISLLLASLVRHNYELEQMKAELEELTYHDTLTGILNRRGAFKYMEKLLAVPNEKLILCYMDLDKFKKINDTYGHGIGDMVLQQFTNIMRENITGCHIFARIGGDEFVLIFKNTSDMNSTKVFFKRISEKLKKSVTVSSKEKIDISFSVGQAVYPVDGKELMI